jgi:hypothetical protein
MTPRKIARILADLEDVLVEEELSGGGAASPGQTY